MQVSMGAEQTTRDGKAKRAIKQSDNMHLFLGARSENEKANAPKQLTLFIKKLFLDSLLMYRIFGGIDSP